VPDPSTPDVVAELWREYKAEGTKDARERLILHYSPLVKFVAGRVAAGLPQSIEQADLVSYGIFGLIDAIDKFDPQRGFKFETYAISRIKGSIIDELRSIDWVPRSVRAKARAIERAYSKLENELRRTPTDCELAEELRMTEDELAQTLSQISFVGVIALDEAITGDRGDGSTLGDTIADRAGDPLEAYELEEMKHILADAINRMPERERLVLTLYYYQGLTIAEIAATLRMSESRVVQLHTKAILQLRARIASEEFSNAAALVRGGDPGRFFAVAGAADAVHAVPETGTYEAIGAVSPELDVEYAEHTRVVRLAEIAPWADDASLARAARWLVALDNEVEPNETVDMERLVAEGRQLAVFVGVPPTRGALTGH
jgi:RNA polymerase sigma factor for flagellar operon FliA